MSFRFKNHFTKLFITLFIILTGCQLQEPTKNHGIVFLENRSNKLILNKSNKNDVIKTIQKFQSRVIVSIDALNGKIKTKGWLKDSRIEVNDLVGELQDNGCKNFIYTDIEKDGTLSHPNFKYISNLRSICKSELYIAGGISDINDITKLKNIGIDGAILGMSIYTGKIDLKNLLNQE